jgi:hypothetical protein
MTKPGRRCHDPVMVNAFEERPVMTIKVYEVRPDGTKRTIRHEQVVEPAKLLEPVCSPYPPCSCLQCRPSGAGTC